MELQKEGYGYVRVSSDEQFKEGFSLDSQITDVQEKAKQLGVTLIHIFKDDGYSAKSLKRPEVQNMLRTIAHGGGDKVLIARHPDRIIRSLTYKRSLQCVFKKYNITVICIQQPWEGTNVDDEVFSDFSMLLSENEIKKIPIRVINGYRGSADLGNYPLGGKPPRGYKKEKNEKAGKGSYLVPDGENAKEIVKIFHTFATNRVTIRQMARYLQKHKVMNLRWTEDQLTALVDNPIYYGRLKTNWYDKEGHTQPLVSKELWQQVQEIVHHRKSITHHHYLFKRIVQCKECGSYLICDPAWKTKANGKRTLYKYYKCTKCNKRINENRIIDEFLKTYKHYKLDIVDQKTIESLETKKNNVRRRINLINKDFDEGLLDNESFNMEIRNAYQSIKEINIEISMVNSSEIENFLAMSELQKRVIIVSNIEKIVVDVYEQTVDIKYKKVGGKE